MVDKTSFMGLGGANLVKGATGQTVDPEALGGARMHMQVSGVAHRLAKDDAECLSLIRQQFRQMAAPTAQPHGMPATRPIDVLYESLPDDHRLSYDMQRIVECLVDTDDFLEFQPEHAPEILCTTARLHGRAIGLLANRRGFLKAQGGAQRVGGIVYAESARKSAYFFENCERQGLPIPYLQDVSGFMVGVEADQAGIIRAGADMVEAMACATVPKIILTVNHASGAGYYAMAGQGFDPNFTFAWPTARIGVMEGDAAVQAVHGPEIDKYKKEGKPLPDELKQKIARTRADYERWLDVHYAAARGHLDAIIDPLKTRGVLDIAFDLCAAQLQRGHLALETL
ncbi:MAG: hypothetical protein FJW31_10610 [Acidobacteria bacterium]|nr:hypothetical protein [Acidobacteriota bacterium]